VEEIRDRACELERLGLEHLARLGLGLRLVFLARALVVDGLRLILAPDGAARIQQAQHNDERETHPGSLTSERQARPEGRAAASSNRYGSCASVGLRRRAGF